MASSLALAWVLLATVQGAQAPFPRRLAKKDAVDFETVQGLNKINQAHHCRSGFEFMPGKCCDRAMPPESPLTEAMALRGYHWEPSAPSREAFSRLFRKLRGGERVNVQVNGGSFTRGNGCTLKGHPGSGDNAWPCSEKKTWATQFMTALGRSFPLADVRLNFNGLGSTTSHFGYALMRDSLRALEATGETIDLVLFDYACNDQDTRDEVTARAGGQLPGIAARENAGDEGGSHSSSSSSSSSNFLGIRLAIEESLRLTLKQGIAFAVVRSCPAVNIDDLQAAYNSVTDYYGAPLLSYADAVREPLLAAMEVKRAALVAKTPLERARLFNGSTSMFAELGPADSPENVEHWRAIFWDEGGTDLDFSAVHPSCSARRFVYEFVHASLLRIDTQLPESGPVLGSLVGTSLKGTLLPRPRFGASERDTGADDPNSACFPAIVEFSTLQFGGNATETPASFFKPTYGGGAPVAPTLLRHPSKNEPALVSPKEEEGWLFLSDSQKHPPGWICQTLPLQASKSTSMAFSISMVHGFVTITYLESYRNAGILEVWVGTKPKDYGSDGSIKTDEDAERLNRPYKFDPAVTPGTDENCAASASFFIDTFDGERSTSEFRERTFNVRAHGGQLLHLRHTGLPEAERVRRGGDKVKVVGIRSC